MARPALPVDAVLPQLLRHLAAAPNAVLIAPPGAGKTTAVAPSLIDEPWCSGQIVMLAPRRLAARGAAERIAETMGVTLGGPVGYATRMDSAHGPDTRILIVTEGIFRRRILADPELAGVSAVLFDEVHERNLDSDFGLALAIDAQSGFRPDLRLVAMSATLDGARFAALLGNAPVIESEGRAYPLELRHVGRDPTDAIEDAVAGVIRRALADEADGDLLAFLPGVRDIERVAARLDGRVGDATLVLLHGQIDPAAQRAAIRRDADGRRKIILATSIAETSLTIDGVRIVVDSGLSRRARYDRASGTTRLVTERVSQAAATQRAGRAARQRPGVAYRLWESAATGGLPRFDPPEILESDLADIVLDAAEWGATDPASLPWLDPPPPAAIDEARARLRRIAAIDADRRITAHGRRIAALPLPPALGHMLLAAGSADDRLRAAEVAVLLGERGLGGGGDHLGDRLTRWNCEGGAKATAARAMAARWARAAGPIEGSREHDVAEFVALAYPDRLARRQARDGSQWASVGGRAYTLDPASTLASAQWLAVADVQGAAKGARILSAAPISEAAVLDLFADTITTRCDIRIDHDSDAVRAERVTRLGAIVLSKGSDATPDPHAIVDALVAMVRAHGLERLPWSDASLRLRRRAAYAGEAGLMDAALLASLDDWLAPLLAGRRNLDMPPQHLHDALLGRLEWTAQQRLDRIAPDSFVSPAGSTHAIDYAAAAGPTVTLRVQALFGLARHPHVGDPPVPLVLSLTSPAGRPIQTTRDLPGFWAGSWRDVAKDMRGRYPRHPWPDDPAAATATLRTKKADARGNSR